MLYISWMVILGDHGIKKKISFEKFDCWAAMGEKLHKQVVYESLGRTPPPCRAPQLKKEGEKHKNTA